MASIYFKSKFYSKHRLQIRNVARYSVRLLTTVLSILLFVYTLTCRRRDFTLKSENKIINIFKIQFTNDFVNLQVLTIMKYENLHKKWSNLCFKNNQRENFI